MLPLADCKGSDRAFALGACIIAAVVVAPFAACAQAVAASGLPPSDSASSASSTSAPRRWILAPTPEHDGAIETVSGFGLFARIRDRSIDAAAPGRLVQGPEGSLFDESAGLGWRQDNVSAMVGYMRPSAAHPVYQDQNISYHQPHGRFGIGLALQY